jgi:hypothetical protein
LNKLLRNIVIQPFLKLPFSPRKPSQKSPGRPSAFGLNFSPDLAISVTSALNAGETRQTYLPPCPMPHTPYQIPNPTIEVDKRLVNIVNSPVVKVIE